MKYLLGSSKQYIVSYPQPKNPDLGKQYGRGNRLRKQINYSDEPIDDQVFNITDYDEENNAASNDYTPVEVPRKREEKMAPKVKDVDIDQLILKEKEKANKDEMAFFEEE